MIHICCVRNKMHKCTYFKNKKANVHNTCIISLEYAPTYKISRVIYMCKILASKTTLKFL